MTLGDRILMVERSLSKSRSDLKIYISDAFHCIKEINQMEFELALLQKELLTHPVDTSIYEVFEHRNSRLQVFDSSEQRA
jgi:nicotinamide mononucleotide adenylyltransferase